MTELCSCGKPLHYTDPEIKARVEQTIAELGPTLTVITPAGSWLVPRHFIALHGLAGNEVEWMAKRFGWEKVASA